MNQIIHYILKILKKEFGMKILIKNEDLLSKNSSDNTSNNKSTNNNS